MFRLDPKVPSVWIYAAAWEFDHNTDVEAARNLMQYALRNFPNSEDLWVEYLRMELTYLSKCKARKVALGEDKGTLVRIPQKADEKQWRDENKELFMSLDEKKEKEDVSPVVREGETYTGLDSFREQGLSVLKTVYSDAVKALPTCFSLRKRFIETLDAIDDSEEMRRDILNDMKRDFSKEPEYSGWLARAETTDSSKRNYLGKEIVPSQLEKAIPVYEVTARGRGNWDLPRMAASHLGVYLLFAEGIHRICSVNTTPFGSFASLSAAMHNRWSQRTTISRFKQPLALYDSWPGYCLVFRDWSGTAFEEADWQTFKGRAHSVLVIPKRGDVSMFRMNSIHVYRVRIGSAAEPFGSIRKARLVSFQTLATRINTLQAERTNGPLIENVDLGASWPGYDLTFEFEGGVDQSNWESFRERILIITGSLNPRRLG